MKKFVVYKSSAGSGKTFTLVLEYLRLCLQDPHALKYNYKKILAITFTNKAASEMKQRVVDALHQIATGTQLNTVGEKLLELLKIDEQELKRRSGIVLGQILHHYSDFSIGTIDSFTHRLVKTFAFDLKLPNNFNIEMDTNGFHNKVISLLLNKIGEDDYISDLLKEFANINAENNESWDPEKQLKEFTNLLLQENAGEFIEKLNQFNEEELEGFRKQFNGFIKYYETELKTESAKTIQLIESNGLSEEDFTHGKGGPQNFFYKCQNLNIKGEEEPGSRLSKAIKEGKWWSKNKNAKGINIEQQLKESALHLLAFIEQNHKAYTLSKLLSKQMYALMLLKKIEEISEELKSEEHIVFLSEFNQKISEIIANEPTPFIYERLGEKYNHYLIDEFQDTSSLQWNNLIPLIENALSADHQNLLVGDGKQSIYRWRNANVIQFAALPQLENAEQHPLKMQQQQTLIRNYSGQVLNTNFRSKEEVVHFNNAFFEFISQKTLIPNFQKIYHEHQQKTNPLKSDVNNKGFVSIELSDDKKIEKQTFYLDKLVQHIQSALEKNYQYEDICILVRKNNHGSIVAQHLSNIGIPVISSDSLLLKNNLEVNTLVAFLEYQIDSNNLISAASILHYLWLTKKIDSVAYHQSLDLLSQKKSLQNILQLYKIDFNNQSLNLNNIFDICIDAIQILKIDLKSSPYIRFFLDEVSNFLNQHNASISKFLEWWEKRREKSSLIIPKGSNAVNVMTIHSSKGLEFPIVIVPFCDWALNQKANKWVKVESDKTSLPVAVVQLTKNAANAGFNQEVEFESQEQILDNLNLLYVAFTRAVDQLYILGVAPKNNQASVYNWLADFTQNDKSKTKFEWGQSSIKVEHKSKQQNNDYCLQPLSFNDNNHVIKIKSSFSNDESFMQATRKGILLHELLAQIKTSKDVNIVIENAWQSGQIKEEEKENILQQLSNIIHHDLLKEYFIDDQLHYIERELIHATGEILRPDRIIIQKERTIIIDYKTGQKNIKKHTSQILKYAEALSDMGYSSIKKILVYLDNLEIVEVI